MDIQTIYDFLRNNDISGVRSITSIPAQMSTALLPCKYVKYGTTSFNVSSLSNNMGLPLHSFDIVFLIEPVGQNNNIENQASVISIAQSIYDYLDGIDNILTVESTNQIILINGLSYWGFVVTVTTLGE